MNTPPIPRMLAETIRAISLGGCLALAACGESSRSESNTVTLFAAASTTDVIRDVADRFTQDTGIEVRLSFAASSTLARQIEEGGVGDLFLSANDAWMDHLQERGLIEVSTRASLLSNAIVVIAPANQRFEWTPRDGSKRLANSFSGRFTMGDPSHVPVGRYAIAALESLGEWKLLDDARFVRASDTRAALRFVELGEVSMGIVYATDATMAGDRVAVIATLPPDSHPPITYPLAALRGSSERDEVGRFVRFLRGDVAKARFREAGFLFDATDPITDRTGAAPPTPPTSPPVFSAEEREIFLLSLRVAVTSVLLSLAPGLALGWLLARVEFRGKSLVDALVHLPLVVPPVALGWLLMITLGANSAVGSFLRERLGVEIAFTWKGAAVASAVMGFPLLVRSVRLGVELVDRRLEEAARTLGATPLRVLYSVTLPLALPGIITGTLLAFARSLGEFGATITFAGNVAGETRTLPVAIYTLAQTPNGDAATLRLVALSVALALIALLASETLSRRWRRRLGGT